MQLYPAIDLKNGQCVRLRQGEFEHITVYSDEPEKVARRWQEQGATYLHLVDLDGALAGYSVNKAVISRIAKAVSIPIEAGGGIRTEETISNMLSLGVKRVIIGTRAVERPEFLREMVEKFGQDSIVAGVDAKGGKGQQTKSFGVLPEAKGAGSQTYCLYGHFQRRNAVRPECGGYQNTDRGYRTGCNCFRRDSLHGGFGAAAQSRNYRGHYRKGTL